MVLAGLDPGVWFMKHQSNDFGGVKKSAVFAFKPKGLRRHGAPLRGCGTLCDDEQEIDECNLFYPLKKLFNGRHQKTMMPARDPKGKKKEQYHYASPRAQQGEGAARLRAAPARARRGRLSIKKRP